MPLHEVYHAVEAAWWSFPCLKSIPAFCILRHRPKQNPTPRSGLCKVPLPEYESHLTSLCKVTARKFPVEVVQQTATLFTDCDNGLHLLAPGVCAAHAEQGGESLS